MSGQEKLCNLGFSCPKLWVDIEELEKEGEVSGGGSIVKYLEGEVEDWVCIMIGGFSKFLGVSYIVNEKDVFALFRVLEERRRGRVEVVEGGVLSYNL